MLRMQRNQLDSICLSVQTWGCHVIPRPQVTKSRDAQKIYFIFILPIVCSEYVFLCARERRCVHQGCAVCLPTLSTRSIFGANGAMFAA